MDVDARGTGVDDFVNSAWVGAAVSGHTILYLDREGLENPQSAADVHPIVRAYNPIDVPDWLFRDGQLRAVKLLEPFERGTLDQPATPLQQTRVIDESTWTLYGPNGERLGGGEHAFGRLPIVVLAAHKRPLRQLIGQSVLGSSKLHVDLYNIISETRELERNQYGLLNVALGDRSVEDARQMMGQETGTGNVMFTPGAAQFLSPEPENITVMFQEREKLVRTMYRLAGVPWEDDSRDAESAESRREKKDTFNQRLSALADHVQQAEYELAELVYRAEFGAVDGPRRFEADGVVIRYPDRFDPKTSADLIEQAQVAVAFEMPPTFRKAMQKRLIPVLLEDLDPSVEEAIVQEIDAQPDPDAERRRLRTILDDDGEAA